MLFQRTISNNKDGKPRVENIYTIHSSQLPVPFDTNYLRKKIFIFRTNVLKLSMYKCR